MDCFPSYATMDKARSKLSERKLLKPITKDGRVGARWNLDDWIKHIGAQRDVLKEMHFSIFRDDHPYVLIVRGDGFHVEQGHGAKLHVVLRTRCKKHGPCSTIGLLTLLWYVGSKPILCVYSLKGHSKKYNNLLTGATCCSEGFGCERLALVEAIALGFIIYLVYQHFMKRFQNTIRPHKRREYRL